MKHYEDNFAHQHLPHADLQPEYHFPSAVFEHPEMLNCVDKLLDRHIKAGNGLQPYCTPLACPWL